MSGGPVVTSAGVYCVLSKRGFPMGHTTPLVILAGLDSLASGPASPGRMPVQSRALGQHSGMSPERYGILAL